MKITVFASTDREYWHPFYEYLAERSHLKIVFLGTEDAKPASYEKKFVHTTSNYVFNSERPPIANPLQALKHLDGDEDWVIVHGWRGIYWLGIITILALRQINFWFINDLSSPRIKTANNLMRNVQLKTKRIIIGLSQGIFASSAAGVAYNEAQGARKVKLIDWRYLHVRSTLKNCIKIHSWSSADQQSNYFFLGRMEPGKGLERLYEISKRLSISIRCFGSPGEFTNFSSHMEYGGAFSPKILPDMLTGNPVIFFPSIYEPLGLIALEVLKYDCIVILSAEHFGFDDALVDNISIYKIDYSVSNTKSLLREIEMLTADELSKSFSTRRQLLSSRANIAEKEIDEYFFG